MNKVGVFQVRSVQKKIPVETVGFKNNEAIETSRRQQQDENDKSASKISQWAPEHNQLQPVLSGDESRGISYFGNSQNLNSPHMLEGSRWTPVNEENNNPPDL